MEPLHTQYDNLNVTRNAPPEVIKAAYKAMAQKWHPDRNQGRSDSERMMKIVNEAYATLIDPIKRKEHDQWIAKEEERRKSTFAGPRPGPAPHAASATHTRARDTPPASQPRPTPEPQNTSPDSDAPPPQAPRKSNGIFSSLAIPLSIALSVWVFTGTTSNKEPRSNSSPSHTSPPAPTPSANQSASTPIAPPSEARPRQIEAEKPGSEALKPAASPTQNVATAQSEPESEMEPGDPATCPSTVTLNVQSSGYSGRIDVELRMGPRPGSILVRRGQIMSTGTLRFANVCNADALFFAFGSPDSDALSVTRSFSVKASESSYNNPEITVYYSSGAESGNKVGAANRTSL